MPRFIPSQAMKDRMIATLEQNIQNATSGGSRRALEASLAETRGAAIGGGGDGDGSAGGGGQRAASAAPAAPNLATVGLPPPPPSVPGPVAGASSLPAVPNQDNRTAAIGGLDAAMSEMLPRLAAPGAGGGGVSGALNPNLGLGTRRAPALRGLLASGVRY